MVAVPRGSPALPSSQGRQFLHARQRALELRATAPRQSTRIDDLAAMGRHGWIETMPGSRLMVSYEI